MGLFRTVNHALARHKRLTDAHGVCSYWHFCANAKLLIIVTNTRRIITNVHFMIYITIENARLTTRTFSVASACSQENRAGSGTLWVACCGIVGHSRFFGGGKQTEVLSFAVSLNGRLPLLMRLVVIHTPIARFLPFTFCHGCSSVPVSSLRSSANSAAIAASGLS